MGVLLGAVRLTTCVSFIKSKHSAADAAVVAGIKMAKGFAPIPVSSQRYEFPVCEFSCGAMPLAIIVHQV